MKKFLLVCSFFLTQFSSAQVKFTDPLFNRLNLSELSALDPADPQDKQLLTFFKAEALYYEDKIHASEDLLNSLLKDCFNDKIHSNSPRTAAVCLLAFVGFSNRSVQLKTHLKSAFIQKWLRSLQSSSFTFEERAYLEGRILWRLPTNFGGDSGKSLVALESLRRLQPHLSSCSFFMGQIYLGEDKPELARAAFERALQYSPPDRRAYLSLKREDLTLSNPSQSGFYFGVVSNPAGGTGFLVGRRDERFNDTKRLIDVSIAAQSRGVYSGRLIFEDEESIPEVKLSTFLVATTEIDQFFGLGDTSTLSSLTEIDQTRSQGRVMLTKNYHPWYLSFGPAWIYRDVSAVKGPLSELSSLRPQQASFFPRLTLGWRPSSRTHWALTGQAAKDRFLSSHTFQTIEMLVSADLIHFGSSRIKGLTQLRWCSDSCPFGMLTEISGSLWIPGVRTGRYRERNGWMGTIDWAFPVWGEASASLFLSGALLSSDFSQLTQQHFLKGGGAAVLLGSGAFKSRLEWGHFNGEDLIQIGLQTSYQ